MSSSMRWRSGVIGVSFADVSAAGCPRARAGWAAASMAGAIAAGAAPEGAGTSWASPYDDLQLALGAAGAGDEIRIARGLYRPGPPGAPRSVTFAIPSGIAVRSH